VSYGLYLHIPFCATKCPYCDFYSGAFAAERIPGYVTAVEAEVERVAAEPVVAALAAGGAATTCFLGGGTPSHLEARDLRRLLGAVGARLPLAAGAEVTAECNPESLSEEKAAALADLGVNRVSLGVQSLDDATLRRLGRPHDAAQALRAARVARARFPQVNFDLIVGVPGLARAAVGETLDRLLELGPDHLSAYGLTVEPGTVFGARAARGELREAPDAEHLAHDALVETRAAAAGLRRYEVSNYARPGAECRHNLEIWRGGHYVGLGPSAHSYLPAAPFGLRRANVPDLAAYVGRLGGGGSPVGMEERPDRAQAIAETLLLGLRLTEGIDLESFAGRFGTSLDEATAGRAAPLLAGGFLVRRDGRLAATPRGRRVLDALLANLAPPRPLAAA
jgi:oxygen-independent coproporphyrinogen-3 oxidase